MPHTLQSPASSGSLDPAVAMTVTELEAALLNEKAGKLLLVLAALAVCPNVKEGLVGSSSSTFSSGLSFFVVVAAALPNEKSGVLESPAEGLVKEEESENSGADEGGPEVEKENEGAAAVAVDGSSSWHSEWSTSSRPIPQTLQSPASSLAAGLAEAAAGVGKDDEEPNEKVGTVAGSFGLSSAAVPKEKDDTEAAPLVDALEKEEVAEVAEKEKGKGARALSSAAVDAFGTENEKEGTGTEGIDSWTQSE